MESSSDISTISAHSETPNEVPRINIEQFLMDSHARSLSSIYSTLHSENRNVPKIFTVAETLKDPLILYHIKPDYGSLGEFMSDVHFSKDLMNQKKYIVSYSGEKMGKIKMISNKKGQKQLNKIYLDKQSSQVDKKVAAKLLVQNLFKDSFGMSLNAFQSQNAQ